MIGRSIHEVLAEEKPLIVPIAHDALSARLIERAGFKAYSVGGFALAAFRYGLPDVGLVSIDLETCRVIDPTGRDYPFKVAEIHRQALLGGLDAIAATLTFADRIIAFQQRDRKRRAWAYFGGAGPTERDFELLEDPS